MKENFMVLASDVGEIFINLLQIVRTSGLGKDEITLHMSDGFQMTCRGSAVGPLVARIAEMAMMSDGANYAEAIRRERAKRESSSALQTEVPPLEG